MATTAKEKFDAAVKVIHSLPKNGPFQPSYEMMLSFYGFFKQATEGPCTKPKPWSFDVVNRKKWDAWNKLGDMPREEAMINYVEELKKTIRSCTEKWDEIQRNGDKRIVEAMPQNEDVRDFMEQLGSFYEIVEEKSPVEDAIKQNNITAGGSTGTSPEHSSSEISEHDDEDFNHSRMVESIVQKQGDQDPYETNNNERLQDIEYNHNHVFPQKPENEQVPDIRENGDDEDIVQPSENVVLVNGGSKVTSESESEEEFCDTSDQPSQDSSATGELDTDVAVSTPLKSTKSNKVENHVHFNPTTTLRTDAEVYQGTLSPIPKHISTSREQLSMSGNFPFGIQRSHDQISDSLLVNAPSEDSLNQTLGSDLNQSLLDSLNLTNSRTSNSFSNSYVPYMPDEMQTARTCGGGENSPPGGNNSGQGRSQGQRSTGNIGSRREQDQRLGGGLGSGYPPGSGGGGRDQGYLPPQGPVYGGINEQIAIAVIRLQQDMNLVVQRLNNLETVARQQDPKKDKTKSRVWNSNWWPFPSLTGRTFFFVLIWPIIVHWLLTMYSRRRQNRKR